MMTIKNCQYLELLRYRKRKSYDNLHDLILKRESFYFDRPEFVFLFSSFFFVKDVFTSRSRRKSEGSFFSRKLLKFKRSRKNVKKTCFSRLHPSWILKIEVVEKLTIERPSKILINFTYSI